MPSVKKPKRKLKRHFLKEWREFRKLDQETAAQRLDISRPQLSRIENGKTGYNQGFIEAAAEAYGCTVADLTMRNPLLDDAPWSIYETLQKADPIQRQLAVDIMARVLKTGS